MDGSEVQLCFLCCGLCIRKILDWYEVVGGLKVEDKETHLGIPNHLILWRCSWI